MGKVVCAIMIFVIGALFGIHLAEEFYDIKKPESVIAIPDATITLETLEKQCELTLHTRKGSKTFVPVTKPADEIITQLKGADSVPNGIHTSYYQVEGLTYNGYNVYAITGFMPEVK